MHARRPTQPFRPFSFARRVSRRPWRAAACSAAFAAACTGLDPNAFQGSELPPVPESAGWAFDAGVMAGSPASGGQGGSSTSPRGGTGPSSGGTDPGDGGEAGADGSGAAPASGGAGARGGTSGDGVAGFGGAGRAGGGAGSAGAPIQSGAGGLGGAGASGGATGGPPVHAFLLSEYVEGSSSYKALEIWALADSTLDGCRIATYFNGALTATGIALSGSVPADHGYVLCTSSLAGLLAGGCQRSTNLSFNGDDAVALECAGEIIDVIGQVGFDPGDAWTSGELSTLNQTLRRACGVELGDREPSDAFDPALEWRGAGIDAFDDLGARHCGAGGEGGAGLD